MRRAKGFLVLLCVAIAGCGSDDDTAAKAGGSITIAQTSQPDFLDPALSYTAGGWEPMWLVYTPLLAYPHKEGKEGSQLVPGLAKGLPTVSPDGKTYELTLRPGLKYSDGTPVKAADFERTIQRVLNLESGGSGFFLGIEGAQEYVDGKKPEADIPGIETDDAAGTITIRLLEPDATFSNVLATNFAGLVPGDTPFENLTKDPPPGVGPYKFTRAAPNREFVLERVESFAIPGLAKGNIDRITTKIVTSPQRQAQDVIANKLDYMFDPPPADLLPRIRSEQKDRYKEFGTQTTNYFFLNVREAPFDKVEVRRAVNLAIDRSAIARLYGGLLEPSCQFLPADTPGAPTGACPFGDPAQSPSAETVAKARAMIEAAGASGAEVSVYGTNDDPTPKVVGYYTDLLNQLGLKAKPELIDGGVYFATIGNEKTKAQTGFVSFTGDFPHPANFFSLFDGAGIQPTNNINFGYIEDPQITDGIAELKQEADLPTVTARWEALGQRLVDEAYFVPFGTRKLSTFVSDRIDFERCTLVHPLYQNDYSSFCLK